MKLRPTRIPDVILIEPKVFEDPRGFFMETWETRKFAEAGIDARFVQDNHSSSSRWVLRGMHYQIRNPQGKLVRVVNGEVFDVAVDMRASSKTFGQWVGEKLSAANRRILWVPPGFAHGFLVMSERADFLYKCTDFYNPAAERAVIWNDQQIGIDWPLPPGVQPLVAQKDSVAPCLAEAEPFP